MTYKDYTICVSVVVCLKDTQTIVDEFDTLHEAMKEYSEWYYDFLYLAAEVIDNDGNLNLPCWGKTKTEALRKLKEALD